MQNLYSKDIAELFIERIKKIEPTTKPLWGKMSGSQMFAHCSVFYELVFTDKYPKLPYVYRVIGRFMYKDMLISKPFKKNGKASGFFIIEDEKSFEKEQQSLINFIHQAVDAGESFFEGFESKAFGIGKLTAKEWNIILYKHLEHHLTQFGV